MAGRSPASVADGALWLTCQKENSLGFDDPWLLISNHSQDFIKSAWQIGEHAVCYPDSSVILKKHDVALCYRELLRHKITARVGKDWG